MNKLNIIIFLLVCVAILINGQQTVCPSSAPISCGSPTTSFCCPSGTTCSDNDMCLGPSTCPASYPVDCNNGYCCPSNTTCDIGGACNPGATGIVPTSAPAPDGSGESAQVPAGSTINCKIIASDLSQCMAGSTMVSGKTYNCTFHIVRVTTYGQSIPWGDNSLLAGSSPLLSDVFYCNSADGSVVNSDAGSISWLGKPGLFRSTFGSSANNVQSCTNFIKIRTANGFTDCGAATHPVTYGQSFTVVKGIPVSNPNPITKPSKSRYHMPAWQIALIVVAGVAVVAVAFIAIFTITRRMILKQNNLPSTVDVSKPTPSATELLSVSSTHLGSQADLTK